MTDVAKDIIQEYIRKYQNISTHAYDLGWFKEMEQADEIVKVLKEILDKI